MGTRSIDGSYRKVCKHGTKCYRRNPEHLAQEAHPADKDYLDCCREAGLEPEFISKRQFFHWCDSSGSGKATRDELAGVWGKIQELSTLPVPDLDDQLWYKLDDDGNGFLNFAEFVDFTTLHGLDLPLGLDDLLQDNVKGTGQLKCGVFDCPCEDFRVRRRRCKYGEKCYQKNEDHRSKFSHPADDDWEAGTDPHAGDPNMCSCGHKKKLHASASTGSAAVAYPCTWATSYHAKDGEEFNNLVPVRGDFLTKFQDLFNATYSDRTTRDRVNHSTNGTGWMVPRDFTIVSVQRNENSRLWRKYAIRKAELLQEREINDQDPEAAKEMLGGAVWVTYGDVMTTKVWESFDADRLEQSINEWYLFHGTSLKAAQHICQNDFKMRLAGTATGTLYGRGTYLAESITKADEYSHEDGVGCFTVLLCRVLGGRVRYCDTRDVDPDALTKDCVEGPYDCILGDRVKISNTYREFVVFDTENVYPEYVLRYKRGEFFKSSSHP